MLTLRANSEEIHAMMKDAKAGILSEFLG